MSEVKIFNISTDITISDLFSKLDTYLIEDIRAILNARHDDNSGVGYSLFNNNFSRNGIAWISIVW
jgi:hypothetical protein